MRKTAIAILLAGLMIGTAAAQNQSTTADQQTGTSMSQSSSGREVMGGTEPEQRIQREVLHELLMLPYYSVFDDLRYEVNGGTVTLLGDVVNPVTKSDAEGAVKHIEGVQKVVNNIKVLPPSNMDDQIRRAEYYMVFGSGGLYRYAMGAVPSIHIIVDNGHVTLRGVVDNKGDKQLAGMRANEVPGVLGQVTNDLQVVNNNSKSGK